ncbi:unnamed protein product [Blepharisma stoltei]|uniref:B box-type domain-containing protein n=1 Tax=Blepharisma stoltei TaxID=1481888 RepID=A0AAU9I7M8_9CILI|nr:unnamed protein product [Blepharisma stoltei]
MFSGRCFKENCQNKLCAKCDCEEKVLLCKEHIIEHVLKPSSKRHQCIQLYFRPSEETRHLVIQKLRELKKDIQAYKKEETANTGEIIKNLKVAFWKHLEKINEIEMRCSKMIEGLLNEEEFLDVANEDDMESVLKLDAQKASIKMIGWNVNCCRLDYKEIQANITKTYEIPFNPLTPFGGAVEDEIESNELSFFRSNTSNFSTINLDSFQISSTTTLTTQETIQYYISCCILPDKTYFYCNPNSGSGITFTIDKNRNVKQLQKSKSISYLDPIFYNNYIYLLGGNNKVAERYDFKQNLWQSISPPPQDLNYNYGCNALFGDSILITGKYLQKIISYSITQNNYKDVPRLLLNSSYKSMLRGNNRIYLFERGERIFESFENDISNWAHIGNNTLPGNSHRQSVVVRYKGNLYFVDFDSQIWKFDLSTKQASQVKSV